MCLYDNSTNNNNNSNNNDTTTTTTTSNNNDNHNNNNNDNSDNHNMVMYYLSSLAMPHANLSSGIRHTKPVQDNAACAVVSISSAAVSVIAIVL